MNIIDINKTSQNDFLFKKIFAKEGNEDMLQELLEDLLDIKIKKIEILKEALIDKEFEENKESRIDIKATIDEHTIVDIEMQVKNEYNIENRSLFAGAALFHNSLKQGEDYNDNKTAIVICILSYNLFEGKDYIVSGLMRRNDGNHKILTDKLQLYYLQLPKFLKQKDKKKRKLAQWLYFISQQDKEGLAMAIKENDKVAKAQKQLDEILSDRGVAEVLEIRLKTKLDKNTALHAAEKRGLEKGLKQGLERLKETAKKMLEKGFSITDISDVTGLTKEEIKKLKK